MYQSSSELGQVMDGFSRPIYDRWASASRILGAVGLVALGSRFVLAQGITIGYAFAACLLPIWLPTLRRFRGAGELLGLGLLAVVSGIALTQVASFDHHTFTKLLLIPNTFMLLGPLLGVGMAIWCRTVMADGWIAFWFGTGLFVAVILNGSYSSANPWKFGFGVPTVICLLALANILGKRWTELGILLALALASALFDARSMFAILLLSAILLAWQIRPKNSSKKGSTARAMIALGTIGVAVYNFGQALILEGFLGDSAQQRSVEQINAAGSIILGGRAELAASFSLISSRPFGYGSGTQPNLYDVMVAKTGMVGIGYDPNNGYVEKFMFGEGYEVHSVIGDVWIRFGLFGMAFCALLIVLIVKGISFSIANSAATGVLIYLTTTTLWNLAFAPLLSALSAMIPLMALILLRSSKNIPADRASAKD